MEVPQLPQEITDASPFEGKPVVVVRAKVDAVLWTQLPALQAPKPGDRFSLAVARAELTRLLFAGGFATGSLDVSANGGGIEVLYRLVPARYVRRVILHGNVLTDDDARREARLAETRDVTEESLDVSTRLLRKYYARRGYPSARVDVATIETDKPLTVVVDVTIDPGRPLLVVRRTFVGLPTWDVAAKSAGEIYGVSPGERADEDALEAADRVLASSLRAVGFHNAIVSHAIEPTPAGETPGVVVIIHVQAGSKLVPDFEGNLAFDTTMLLALLDLPNEPDRSPARLASKIEDAYRRRGYLDVRVSSELLGATADPRRILHFRIQEGTVVTVARRIYPCLRGALGAARLDEEVDSYLDEALEGGGFGAVDGRVVDSSISSDGSIIRGARPLPPNLEPRVIYAPEVYERAVEHLRDLFRSEGYIFAEIGESVIRRARCAMGTMAGTCKAIDPPPIAEADICKSDLDGLPRPIPPLTKAQTCVSDAANGVECAATVEVVIPINPGPRSYLWDVSFDGARAIAPAALGGPDAAGGELRMGDPVSLRDVENARRKVLDYYKDEGFFFAAVRANLEYSPDKSRARVRFVVNEGEQVIIDHIFVEGNKLTLESLIRARLLIEENGVYHERLRRASQERLGRLGVFSSVSIGLVNPTIPGKHKNVVVSVVERLEQHVELRGGFASGEGIRGYFEYGYANIFGYALSFDIRAKASYQPFLLPKSFYDPVVIDRWKKLEFKDRIAHRISVGFTLPHTPFFGTPVRSSIEVVQVLDLRRDFELFRRSAIATVTYTAFDWWTIVLAAAYEHNDFNRFVPVEDILKANPGLAPQLRVPDGTTSVIAQRATFNFDWRDNRLAATKNGFFSITPEWVKSVQTAPDNPRQDFLHLSASGGVYFKLSALPKKPILAIELQGGVNFNIFSCNGDPTHTGTVPRKLTTLADPFGGTILTRTDTVEVRECDTYPDRLFYLGGIDTIRGFNPGQMVPQDILDELAKEVDPNIRANAPTGGDVFVNPRIELRVPAFKWGGFVLFADGANSWRDKRKIKPWILRYAVGPGLSIDTPVGPIALDLGFNVSRRRDFFEPLYTVHFAIGRF